jgi:shikimate kinase
VSADCRVLLIGMMGSGKSTIGRLLSEATGWPYVDNDELVRRAHGATARELLARRGADAMRDAEADALALGTQLEPPAIVGVAAGVVLDADGRDTLEQGGLVVWLRAGAETLAARASGADHRPWLDADSVGWMRQALEEREPLYASVADHVVDTEAGTPAESAERLRGWLAETAPCGQLIADRDAPA